MVSMRSTLKDEETINDLSKAQKLKGRVFEDDALVFGNKKVSEEEVVKDILSNLKTIRIGEREIKLPGLIANEDMIVNAVAKFKDQVYDGNIKPSKTAGHDDIVVELAWANVMEKFQAGDVHNFKGTISSEGETYDVAPLKGVDGTGTLDDEEWLFFTGDFIDLASDAVITAIQYVDVDGETNYNPEGHIIFSERDSDIQLNKASAALAKSTFNIDAYGQEPGDVELVPVAIHISQGKNVPGL